MVRVLIKFCRFLDVGGHVYQCVALWGMWIGGVVGL